MPSFTKYCLRVGCVNSIRYRNAEVLLETIPFPKFGWSNNDYWVFRARRLGETEDKVCILHESRLGRYYLEQELFRQGFIVADKTPAALILDRLVRDGYASSRARAMTRPSTAGDGRDALAAARRLPTFLRMCNHYDFTNADEVFDFTKAFEGVEEPPPWEAVATAWPKSKMPVIYGNHRARTTMRWGIWSTVEGRETFGTNSRDDRLLVSPIWKKAVRERRCLVPANGFFEWAGPAGAKWEVRFSRQNGRPFFFAGIWSADPGGGQRGFSLVTTTPASIVAALPHDRMPVILRDEDALQWVGGSSLPDERLLALCQPYPGELVRQDLARAPRRTSITKDDLEVAVVEQQTELF